MSLKPRAYTSLIACRDYLLLSRLANIYKRRAALLRTCALRMLAVLERAEAYLAGATPKMRGFHPIFCSAII